MLELCRIKEQVGERRKEKYHMWSYHVNASIKTVTVKSAALPCPASMFRQLSPAEQDGGGERQQVADSQTDEGKKSIFSSGFRFSFTKLILIVKY